MADIADEAARHDFTEEALRRMRSTVLPEVKRGNCLNCDEPTVGGHLYCDDYCRKDYERRTNCK
jgi:hypothetical protein